MFGQSFDTQSTSLNFGSRLTRRQLRKLSYLRGCSTSQAQALVVESNAWLSYWGSNHPVDARVAKVSRSRCTTSLAGRTDSIMAIVIDLSSQHKPLLQKEKACYLAPGFRHKVWQLEKVWTIFPNPTGDLANSFFSSPPCCCCTPSARHLSAVFPLSTLPSRGIPHSCVCRIFETPSAALQTSLARRPKAHAKRPSVDSCCLHCTPGIESHCPLISSLALASAATRKSSCSHA